MSAGPAGATASLLERESLRELIQMHANVLRRLPPVQLVLAAGVAAIAHPAVPAGRIVAWASMLVGVECLRALYAHRLLQRATEFVPRREHARLTLFAGCAGLANAMMAVLFFPHLALVDQAVLGIVLFAIPAAGVAVSMSSRLIIAAFSLMVIGPTCVAWGLQHRDHLLPAIGMGLLYCALMIVVAGENEKMLRRSIAIRFERDQMVRRLEQSNVEIAAAVDRAEQAAQSRARVLAAASHDLRQPLHALSVYSAVLAQRPTTETLSEVGENVHAIVRSLGSLLTGLLDVSKLSTGYFVADRQLFAVDQLIAEVDAEFRVAARERGLRLTESLSPAWIEADAGSIARIARNLIDNALKYTDQGEVRVTVDAVDGHAVLRVADTGRGIPADEQARVFEEFYQVDNPGRDRDRGAGLGLAIVQKLCELNGCRITLVSTPAVGSEFVVTLGRLREPAPDVRAGTPQPPAQPLAGLRVLVVDNEASILASMSTLLGSWGAEVFTADSAQATRDWFERQPPPDVAILDLRLGPGEHGAELGRDLQRRFDRLAVLIVTGETSSDALEAANASSFPLLLKPLSSDKLLHALRTLADRQIPTPGSPAGSAPDPA